QDIQSTLTVTVRADMFGSVQEVRNLLPCGETLSIQPDLEQYLVFSSPTGMFAPVQPLLVLGFQAVGWQPPNQCILWPDPQIVVALPIDGISIDMLQPHLHGLNFLAQAVTFWPFGLPVRSSSAYSIQLQ